MSPVLCPPDTTTDEPQLDWDGLTAGHDDGPDLTLGMMSDLAEGALLDAWNRVRDIQTRGFGPREVQWLREAGFFSGARDVLEVGSGDGTVFCYPQVMMTATKRGDRFEDT